MKARISAPAPKLAVGINLPEDHSSSISKIMSAAGGKYISAEKDCALDTVGALCGYRGYSKSRKRVETDAEILIFSGLVGEELTNVLNALKSKGVNIPLKALVTPHNKDWTVSALAEELAAEHKYVTEHRKRDTNGQE